jgi:hypothetical protein
VEQVPDPGFSDIAGSAHQATIACAAWYGITTGRTTSRFAPGSPVTRAQMASFLVRMIDYAATNPGSGSRAATLRSTGQHRFTDVPRGSPHARSINRLAAAGIIMGGPGRLPSSSFGPRQRISRGQMASLLARTVSYIRDRALPEGGNVFADDGGSTHENAINRLAGAGIAQGSSPGLYRPDAPVRRGAMASFLQRTMELLVAAGTTAPPS